MRTAAVAAAVAAAALVPGGPPGIGVVVAAVLVALTIAGATGPSLDVLLFGVPALVLASFAFVLDAGWVVAIDLTAAAVLASVAVSGARVDALVAPVRALGGVPVLVPPRPAAGAPALRGALLGGLLVLPFGALFWSADPAFAEIGSRVPAPDTDSVIPRLLLFGLVLVGALGLALAAREPRPAGEPKERHRLATPEWAIPLACLDLLFVAFVAVQVTVLFGGHDHVLETAELTYSEYARQGFWQLIAAAVLTLGVVAAATVFARPMTRAQRLLVRVLLGLLCALTLVVLVSALHRLRLYEQTYGLTRRRLLAEAFALWVGVLLLLVLAAGAAGRVREQLPRAAVAVTAAGLVAFSLASPDRVIAERNLARWRTTGEVDARFLATLSADAVPVLAALPQPLRGTAVSGEREQLARGEPWTSANLARRRARDLLGLRASLPTRGWGRIGTESGRSRHRRVRISTVRSPAGWRVATTPPEGGAC
jgi:hypothetical protein